MEEGKDFGAHLLTQYGPLISGKDLYTCLGFKTYAAFYRAKQLNEIDVNVFRLHNRKGWFAKTADVAKWIETQSEGHVNEQITNKD